MSKFNKIIKLRKNGFTLIELLAVILILGIIALIAIPTVNKILEESRKEAFKSTLNEVNKAIENACTLSKIKNLEPTTTYTITNGIINPKVDIKGNLPNGFINVDNDCGVTFNLANKDFEGLKNSSKGPIVIDKYVLKNPVSNSTSYVGYYADVNGDRKPDGIIFADLLFGKTGQWSNENGDYEIPTINSNKVKKYYISQSSYKYKDNYIEKPVISIIPGSEGMDRYYVIALSDFNNGADYRWYYNAHDSIIDVTSDNFGMGKLNTNTIIEKWNNNEYGDKNGDDRYKDLWGEIKQEVENGWFIPSREELSAFFKELNINSSNYTSYGLNDYYWSSSQIENFYIWYADLGTWQMETSPVDSGHLLFRLVTSF